VQCERFDETEEGNPNVLEPDTLCGPILEVKLIDKPGGPRNKKIQLRIPKITNLMDPVSKKAVFARSELSEELDADGNWPDTTWVTLCENGKMRLHSPVNIKEIIRLCTGRNPGQMQQELKAELNPASEWTEHKNTTHSVQMQIYMENKFITVNKENSEQFTQTKETLRKFITEDPDPIAAKLYSPHSEAKKWNLLSWTNINRIHNETENKDHGMMALKMNRAQLEALQDKYESAMEADVVELFTWVLTKYSPSERN